MAFVRRSLRVRLISKGEHIWFISHDGCVRTWRYNDPGC